jgi:V-type H+-transporting ATPase subunit H
LLERAQSNLALVLDNEEDAREYVTFLIKIADQCQNNVTIQKYAFTRVEEILGLHPDYNESDLEVFGSKHAKYFLKADTKQVFDAPFIRALNSADNTLQKSAAIGLASLFSAGSGDILSLVSWINSKFVASAQGHGSLWEVGLPALITLMRSNEARKVFLDNNGLTHVVSRLNAIGANGNAQYIYDLSFIIWTLTLMEEIETRLFLSSGAIATLSDFLAKSPSRKVTRVIVAAMKNLASTSNDDVLTEMFSANLEKILENLAQSSICKNSTDSEFDADVKALSDVLLRNYRDLSTFDRWMSEVQSGGLRWGVVHTEKFWRENAHHVETHDFKYLKLLIALLSSADTVSSLTLVSLRITQDLICLTWSSRQLWQ